MHAISSYRGNRHHPPATNTDHPPAHPLHTNRQDRLQYTVPQLASAQCNKIKLLRYCTQFAMLYKIKTDRPSAEA